MRALVRDTFTCQAHQVGLPLCHESRLRCLQVHHRQPRAEGGTHDLENLLTLCRSCHARLHPWRLREIPRCVDSISSPDAFDKYLPMSDRELI
jgi:5-methylcytosine-specific restriction endonuclease McrA